MQHYIRFADTLSAWFGKVFAWCVLAMTIGVGYEVVVRYAFNAPTPWSFDLSYIMYGTLFMMAGAYTLSRDGHVRGDFIYRLWRPRTQAIVELVLYFLFFFPGVLALIFAGWRYAARSCRYLEVSSNSPANIPIFHFKTVIVAACIHTPVRRHRRQRKTWATPWMNSRMPAATMTVLKWKIGMLAGLMLDTSR